MNEYFVIYDVGTGQELIRGFGPEGTAGLQSLIGNRGVVTIPAEDFNAQTQLLDIDPIVLRASLWDFTKTIRASFAVGGAVTSWGIVDSQPLHIQNLQLKVGVAMLRKSRGDDAPLEFTMKDNSVVSLTPTEMMVMAGEAMEFVDGIYNYARDLRTQMDAAQTAQEVLAVDIFRGWPAAQSA
ncbi:DUF4376 domain-containing protein [Sphingobium sp. HDIP04]|uniref:DUF4376 domain-containing protein n=1 Tax=Sphingobium sp. HDIP04 TaxID=428994 RepID=UPI0003875DDF|nr:DUF4376 domain-containing protein [Sphingobium sp. HDIP04]EQA97272.1 hypothetical protein L286_23390 [Sphingobium sp. HDIP04]